jgi:single-stranded DNA-binding protein
VGIGDGDARQYVRISVFGSLAERLAVELAKGAKVYVEAHSLRMSEWTSRTSGEVRTGLQAVATKVEKIGTSVIGHNRPKKPRASKNTDQPTANGGGGEAARNWQAPLDAEIPFAPEVRG